MRNLINRVSIRRTSILLALCLVAAYAVISLPDNFLRANAEAATAAQNDANASAPGMPGVPFVVADKDDGSRGPTTCVDLPEGNYTKEELDAYYNMPIRPELSTKTPPGPLPENGTHEANILTIVLDFKSGAQANTTDIFGNVVGPFDPVPYGFVAGDFNTIANAVLAEVDQDYFDELAGTVAGPPGMDLQIDFILGDIGTPPPGVTNYYYMQIGSRVSGPHNGLGVAGGSVVRNTGGTGPNFGIAVGDVVGSIFTNNIQTLSGLTPSNALTSGNLGFTTFAIAGTTAHEAGHTLSLSHVNKVGSTQPTAVPPLMGTGAIDLPNNDRIYERTFSLSGVDGENANNPVFHIPQLVGSVGLHGATCTTSFTNSTAITIPSSGNGSLYPSPIVASGLVGNISDLSVRINGFSHTFSDDVGIVLVGPTGAAYLLQDGAGAGPDMVNITYTLSDSGATQLPANTAWPAGTYRPYNAWSDSFPAPGPGTTYGNPGPAGGGAATFASVYGGSAPNGTWRLYVRDFVGGDSGSIAGGWTLNVTAGCAPASVPTNTGVTSSANPSVFGQNVTFTATVAPVPTGGTVQFVIDGSNFGAPVAVNGSGQATVSTSALSVGGSPHSVVANYSGTAGFDPSNGTLTPAQTVNASPTTTTITSDAPDPSVYGQSITVDYTVVASGGGAGTPTGNVNVTISGGAETCTGTVASGSCSMVLTNVAAGRTITATYVGDASFAGSNDTESHTVNKADTVTTINSDNPDPSVFGQMYTVDATVAGVIPPPPPALLNGTLDLADPTFNRSLSFSQGGSCTLSGIGTAVHYKTLSVPIAAPTNITLSLVPADGATITPGTADTVMMLHGPGPFNPASPCTNAITANDDAVGVLSRVTTTTPLAAGTYTLVVTSFSNTPADFPWAFTVARLDSPAPPPAENAPNKGDFALPAGTVPQYSPVNKMTSGIRAVVTDPSECGQYENYAGREPEGWAAICGGGAAKPSGNVAGSHAPTDMGFAQDIGFVSDNFVSFTLNNFPGQTTLGSNAAGIFGYDFDATGTTLYALNNDTQELGTINQATGAFTSITACANPGGNWTGLSIDPTSNVFYASTATNLYVLNPATCAQTLIGPFGSGLMIDIAVNPAGVMYGHDIGTDSIYTINTATGAATLVGPTGILANFAQGMDFDNDDGTLYIFLYQGSGANTFGTVNLATGAVTPLATSNPTGEFEGAIPSPAAPPPGVNPPTGTITVTDDVGNMCTITLPATSCDLPSTVVGLRTLTATYNGDGNYNGSNDTEAHQINKAPTTTTVASNNNPSVFGANVSFTATVVAAPPGAGTPSGTVTFNIDGNLYCVGTPLTAGVSAPCTLAGLPALPAGNRVVVAIYNG
ncbi:MAG: Ig-like domain repeat protein, partial [Pyrinomonadaceae bacterium]